jgi:hypothetical protein
MRGLFWRSRVRSYADIRLLIESTVVRDSPSKFCLRLSDVMEGISFANPAGI